MRCLTLATYLREKGAEVSFACRAHPGNLIEILRDRKFSVHELPLNEGCDQNKFIQKKRSNVEDYVDWLGCSQKEDARATFREIGNKRYDWLVVDHYALDVYWESQLRSVTQNLMVIDDLANRRHDCDLLLDQNYFADDNSRYQGLIPVSAMRLLGPTYALLRPEFAAERSQLQAKRGKFKRIFVFFGGTDPDNITGLALGALSDRALQQLEVDVVIGSNNPNQEEIIAQVARRPQTNLHVQTSKIAELMAHADLAIGAGGTTTWERICLGLPSLVFTLAENQVAASCELEALGAIEVIKTIKNIDRSDLARIIKNMLLKAYDSRRSASMLGLVDGLGTLRVLEAIRLLRWLLKLLYIFDSICDHLWHLPFSMVA